MAHRIKDLEVRLERTEGVLRLVQRISRMLARERALSESLPQIVGAVVDVLQCDSCLLYLLDHEQLVLCASHPEVKQAERIALQVDEGLTGWVAREKRLLAISREAYLDPRFKLFTDLPEDTFEAFLSVPIIAQNKVIGVINVQHRQPHSHDGNEMEVLTMVGEQVGALVSLVAKSPGEAVAQMLAPNPVA